MVGYDPEEFIRNASFWYDHVHPEDRVIVSEAVPKIFEKELHAYEYRFKCKDGRYIWVRDEMKLVRDHNGNPLEIIGFWMDITDHKRAEKEIQERVKELEAFYAIAVDRELRMIELKEKIEELKGKLEKHKNV